MKTKIIALMILTVLLASAAYAVMKTSIVVSTDSSGTEKGQSYNPYHVGEDLYAMGSEFEAGDECDVYVFENGNWEPYTGFGFPPTSTGFYNVSVGDSIPMAYKVAGPVAITINGDGTFDNTLVWPNIDKTGTFDIIVDCGENGADGVWDGKVTADGVSRDGADWDLCVGLYVVPEQVIAVGLIAILVPGMIYFVRRKSK